MLLEIKVISALDLPPVSRILRTYTVACLDYDNKSQTAVDRHGGTNPTWNQKMVFSVDDKFLSSKTSEIKFEIYNVAWLRDLPMGTASLVINAISPPISSKNRSVALRICRPTGHLQGILNICVQLKDNNNRISKSLDQQNNVTASYDGKYQLIMPTKSNTNKNMQKKDDTLSLISENTIVESKEDKSIPKMANVTKGQVSNSTMRRSEVAGDYLGGDVEEDSIFENWAAAVAGDGETTKRCKSLTRQLTAEDGIINGKRPGSIRNSAVHRRSQSDGVGLFSFSSSCMNLKLICGSNNTKKKKRPLMRKKKMVDDNGVDDDDHTVALLSW